MCGKLGNYIEDSTKGDDNGVVEEKLSIPQVPISFFCFSFFPFLFFLFFFLKQLILFSLFCGDDHDYRDEKKTGRRIREMIVQSLFISSFPPEISFTVIKQRTF